MSSTKKASEIATMLTLQPHPEGGFFSETFRDSSIILPKSLLPPQYKIERISFAPHAQKPGTFTWESLSWYVDGILFCSTELGHSHPQFRWVLELSDDGMIKMTNLGNDLESGQRPQYTVAPNVWFGSFPTMDIIISEDGNSFVKAPAREADSHYSLVGCTCAPAFQFEDFELAKRSELVSRFPTKENWISYLTLPD